jgi:putative transposase
MGRPKRAAAGGWIYHAFNRANARTPIYWSPEDYEAFERVLAEAFDRTGIRLLSYCVMPNHWHFVLWPEHDGDLAAFMQ